MKINLFKKGTSLLFFTILLLGNIGSQVQNPDSLENVVKTGSCESKLEALSDLTLHYQNSDISKALRYGWQQKHLAKLHQQTEWLADAYENLGLIYFYEQQADSAEFYFGLAMDIWTTLNNRIKIATSLSNMSNAMRLKMQPDSAIMLLQKALVIFENEKNDDFAAQTLANIASIYNDVGNHQKHDEYALKALNIQEKLGSSRPLGITLINLCLSMQAQHRLDEAVNYGERAVKVFKDIDQQFFICAALIRVGDVLFDNGEKERAIKYMNEAISYADKIGSVQLKIETLRQRANYYLQTEYYSKAKADAEEALALTDTLNTGKVELVKLYDLLTTASIYTNEKDDILKYLKKYVETKNIVQQEKWIDQISDMEIKYETDKKELKINVLEKEKRLYIWLGIAGGVILLLLLVSFIIRQRLAVNRRKLAETRIKQMEQERQLVATQAALDGENAERTRLARDLHDGLGSMLSVVKLNLPEMNSNGVLEADDITRFNRAITMLDESISELRRIAHHIMPESLTRYGLKASLSDFCHSIPSIEFHYFGNDQRLDSKLEILIYRAAHELINNALKHAEAAQINVQLVQEDDRISLTVHDNGKGFDPALKTEGMGLANIRNRIAAHNGILLIDSKPEMGTEVNVELRVERN